MTARELAPDGRRGSLAVASGVQEAAGPVGGCTGKVPPTGSVVPLLPASVLRARVLLALSLLNQRASVEGLTPVDVRVLREALLGGWD